MDEEKMAEIVRSVSYAVRDRVNDFVLRRGVAVLAEKESNAELRIRIRRNDSALAVELQESEAVEFQESKHTLIRVEEGCESDGETT